MGLYNRSVPCLFIVFFFFNDTATTEIYTLSLHDALPICREEYPSPIPLLRENAVELIVPMSIDWAQDRKSTRLNSSHSSISYAVFCLKKKKNSHSESSRRHCNLTWSDYIPSTSPSITPPS